MGKYLSERPSKSGLDRPLITREDEVSNSESVSMQTNRIQILDSTVVEPIKEFTPAKKNKIIYTAASMYLPGRMNLVTSPKLATPIRLQKALSISGNQSSLSLVRRKGTEVDLCDGNKTNSSRITHKHIDLNESKVVSPYEEAHKETRYQTS